MNIYLIEQDKVSGYDTYDSAVVLANSEAEAQAIHPDGVDPKYRSEYPTWPHPEDRACVSVTLLGPCTLANTDLFTGHVVCASFNAG